MHNLEDEKTGRKKNEEKKGEYPKQTPHKKKEVVSNKSNKKHESPEYKNFEEFFLEEREKREKRAETLHNEEKNNNYSNIPYKDSENSENSSDNDSDNSSFYKSMYLTQELDDNSYFKKYSSFLNYKNYFNFVNGNEDNNESPEYKCEICHEKDTGMILCDICYSAVHEKCLNSPKKIEEDWICDRCSYLIKEQGNGKVSPIPCFYCPSFFVKGLMKCIKEGYYAHFDCDNYFMNDNNKEFICKNGKCYLCNQNTPYMVKCQYDKCGQTYHYKCQLKKSKQYFYCDKDLLVVDDILLKKKRKHSNNNINE